jgi:hypothetical protein
MRILAPSAALFATLVLGGGLLRAEEKPLQFETDVRPILKANCFACHGEEGEPKGGLDLRLARWIIRGGESGPAIAPGQAAESYLYQRIAADEMPPVKKKLTEREKAIILKWIDQGAKTARPEPETIAAESPWTEEERSHWSLQPVRRPSVPQVNQADQVRTPIDAFLLARLEEKGLGFSPPADRRTLIRRLSFDLLGLPPSPERVEEFAADERPDAYDRLVEEMLASPAYGERWARHWLDVAGYADSDGYTEKDPERPWAFRYRDWVIRAFNADMPLDEFVVEQLAGDELIAPPYENLSAADADKLAATGFLRMAPDGTGGGGVDQNAARNDVVAETIKIVSSSMLGLTVGCAQCHNHRYDPISQVDYYRFRAIFEPALDVKNWRAPSARVVSLWSKEEAEQAAKVDAELREIERQRKEELDAIVADIFEKEIAKLDAEMQGAARLARSTPRDQRTAEQKQLLKDHPSLNVDGGSAYLYEPQRLKEFKAKYEKLTAETKARRPEENYVACLTEVPGQSAVTHVFYRGDFNQPREQVSPSQLSVLGDVAGTIAADDAQLPTTGRRLAFARNLTSGRHPLLPRVLANRVWMHHFGRGLVQTPADFGVLGERPSHPELLDHLADELVRSGWRLKDLHRLIVTSTAYRQSSARTEALESADPQNRLLGRMSVRRLEAEAIRDAILAAARSGSRAMFGPPATVNPDEVGQVVIGKATRDGNGIMVAKAEQGEEAHRRSVYVQVRRSMPLGMLEPFDVASTAPNCELRPSSTVAPQSLLLMNSAMIVEQSERFAKRVAAEAGNDPAAQARRAWELAFARSPSEADVAEAVAYLAAQREHFAAQAATAAAAAQPEGKKGAEPAAPALDPAQQALATFCQALFCANEFLYVD